MLIRWPIKFAGTSVGMAAFFVAYFWVLRHPFRPVALVPLTAVDHWITFQPWALGLYLSLWFYVSIGPAFLTDAREMISYTFAAVELCVVGLVIFFFWPTAVPPADVDWADHPTLAFLKSADASGNACPSLHVAFAVFTALWLQRIGRHIGAGRSWDVINWLWCAGIIYSTVAIRQHVALDVLTGAPLGAAVALLHLRQFRTPDW